MRFGIQRAVVLATVLISVGCYSLVPVANQPLPLGAEVALTINDAGRAVLGGTMGPEIGVIQGRLTQRDTTEYVLAVTQISLLRGGEQVWSGERVHVKREYVSLLSEKRFSRGKTAIISAAAVGALVLIFKQGIIGNLAGEEDKTPPDTNNTTRIPRFVRK